MLIAGAVIVVLALLFVFLGILPLFQEASDVDAQIATEETNLQTAQALVARRQSAKAQSAANEVELMRIANRIPDSPQLPSVIIELQDLANDSNLLFSSLTVSGLSAAAAEGTATPAYSRLPFTLVVKGDWADVTEYLHDVMTMERGMRVVSVTFNRIAKTETDPAMMQANVSAEVYVMAPASAAPGSAGATTGTEAAAPGAGNAVPAGESQ